MSLSLIPDSAPFTGEQRAWLNGFLAGWLGLQESADQATTAMAMAIPALDAPAGSATAPPPAPVEEFPWHDPALTIDDRLKLAEGKPIERRLMAAMAQLDCGACGYLCQTYSEAIASGAEPSLTLCSPGGSETSKTLKRLVKEQKSGTNGTAPTNGHAATAIAPVANGWSRKNPYTGRLLRSVNLSGPGSDKEIRHVEIDLGQDGPSYEVGDALGICPTNCDELVEAVITTLGATGDEPVSTQTVMLTSFRAALALHCCLTEVTEDLLEQLAIDATDDGEADQIRALIVDDEPIRGFDVLDLLRRFPSSRPSAVAFAAALAALKPRLYSISSSPKKHAGQVHLTVRKVTYDYNDRLRKGVASTMLADRVAEGQEVRVFVQKSHGFTIPADPNAPMIMIGPGTGIAPFRSFLQEREALGAPGKNWLFFGDQRGALDFLYRDELQQYLDRGILTRLDTAFSRDQDEKVYVQHRMIENGRELFSWIDQGGSIFVCGDAKRMASDVDKALRQIIREHGGMSDEAVANYVTALLASGRYCRDVY